MSAEPRPYPSMKESGDPLLGAVPAHWEQRQLRQLLRSVADRNRPDLPLLSVVRERGVILRDVENREENHNFVPDDLTNYKVVRAGQFAMNKMKAWQGSYGVSDFDGLVSPAYFVFDLTGVGGDFFHTAIRSRAYVPFFTQASDGVRIGQWDLSRERMKEIPFSLPPPDEQAAIVRFLDHADRRIRRYIRAKQRLIELLEEQKQAIIHRAVTRGLDPNVRLKPSGVEWLGDVPEHWEVRRLRDSVAVIANGIWGSDPNGEDDIACVRVADFDRQRGRVELDAPTLRAVTQKERKGRLLEPGDLLLEKSGGGDRQPVGAMVLYEHEHQAVCSNFIGRVVTANGYDSRFLLQLHAHLYAVGVNVRSIKQTTGIQNLDARSYFAETVAFPPLTEQTAIAGYLDATMNALHRALSEATREIELLREYRTRLIADVVTGKLDVREAASQLPDEVDESDDLDDIDMLADGEDIAAEELATALEEVEA